MLAVAAYQNIKCVDTRDNAMLGDVGKSVILGESANKVELLVGFFDFEASIMRKRETLPSKVIRKVHLFCVCIRP